MQVIAVTNDRLPINKLSEIIVGVEPFVDFFIIRERSKTAKEWLELMNRLIQAHVSPNKLIVNDRVDVALVANIQRVQLPSHGLTVQQVKDTFPHLLVGTSVHSMSEAQRASSAGADWLLYGHIFETDCKPGVTPRGLAQLRSISETISTHLYAIGGIQPNDIKTLSQLGIHGVAVMSTIFESDSPMKVAKAFDDHRKALMDHRGV